MTTSTQSIMLVSDIQNKDIQIVKVKDTKHFEDMFQISNKKLLIRRDICFQLTDGTSYWAVQTGQDGGKLVEKINVYTEGKGKKTAFEQAISEAESKREKKRKKDKYAEGRENAIDPKNDPYPPPMLAEPKEKTKITFPCFAQRKLDGNRCMAKVSLDPKTRYPTKVEMYSRAGNFFKGLPHIEEQLRNMASQLTASKEVEKLAEPFINDNYIIFDGELFTLEYPFQELNGVLKLDDLNPDDYKEGSKEYEKAIENRKRKSRMQFWVYDVAVKRVPQWGRAKLLHAICDAVGIVHGSIKTRSDKHPIVLEPYITIKDQEQLDDFHGRSVEDGFEGTIARMHDAGYLFKKRSKELVKIKDFKDEEFECVGMRENDKLPGTGTFICKTKEGAEFEAMPDGSMEERSKLWDHYQKDADHFKGKDIHIKFFEKYPDTGIPRFPVARVRDEH